MKRSDVYRLFVLCNSLLAGDLVAQNINFVGEELLGCPTNNSIVINILPESDIEYYYEYGIGSDTYSAQTALIIAVGNKTSEMVISGLLPDTRYFYRMQYRTPGGNWVVRNEHSFHTQRASGSSFKFTIISDSHADYDAQYRNAVMNIRNDQPDFHLDLGDTYMTDNMSTQSAVNNAYLAQRDPNYMDGIGNSAPIFLASGNHENEEGWNFDDNFSIALASVKARKTYFPTPVPDDFYTGNSDPLAALDTATFGNQYREDYYAFTWGDALFIVFDPFQYTMNNPYGATAGESGDETVSGDRWNWTLGQQQYNWLKQTLDSSNAKYKFMFAHHQLGGTENYVREGAGPAHLFEWGGRNADGTTWAFDTRRPGWGDDPIHQLMIDNQVSAYFHGHDHQYAYEVREGIVYQCVPKPSSGLEFNYYSESDPYTERVLSGPGSICVSVTPSVATVEYISSNSSARSVSHSYTILPGTSSSKVTLTIAADPIEGGTTIPIAGTQTYSQGTTVEVTANAANGFIFDHWAGNVNDQYSPVTTITLISDENLTAHFQIENPVSDKAGNMNGDGLVNSTDALIILSCDAGIDVSQFCPVNCGDINDDGVVNSTDALIILSFDAGMSIPYPVGEAGCPTSVTPCNGCAP